VKLLIHAVNIHNGGGAILLKSLLSSIEHYEVSCIAFLDERLNIIDLNIKNINTIKIIPKIFNRLYAELLLKRKANESDVVLCFGNLPPLFKLDSKVLLFLQNRYLIDKITTDSFKIKDKIRIALEKWWLRIFCKNVNTIIVQTPSMRQCVQNYLGMDATIIPFAQFAQTHGRSIKRAKGQQGNKYNFIYVSSGEPHKNHRQLIKAWSILASEGIRPTLCLTLDKTTSAKLCQWINDMTLKHDLKILNVGFVTHNEVLELYRQSQALIYPSSLESFGLSLIEARIANLPILASELDYVRDVIDPEETFDPYSPVSIARAVKRFVGCNETNIPLLDPKSFLEYCINQ
jgi:glycosyltransferase involved in cell wall biosynthesis